MKPGFTTPAKFKPISRKRIQAIRNALVALEMAQKTRNGQRAAKYADRVCALAMKVQSHFHFMRPRACFYVREDEL